MPAEVRRTGAGDPLQDSLAAVRIEKYEFKTRRIES